ncbi:MAG: entericidin A/B family lipoprotein [Sulfuricellaceae bacterium]|nr:entericidin A/B family lipoprotein [Sulfuricellaceae bacterium]
MLKRVFMTLLTLLSIVGAAATLTGCNTMEGAGKDVQQAGQAIKNEANERR